MFLEAKLLTPVKNVICEQWFVSLLLPNISAADTSGTIFLCFPLVSKYIPP